MNLPTHRVARRVDLATSAALAGLVAVTGLALTSFSDGVDDLAPAAGVAYSNTTTTITGTPRVGETVTADTSAWQPAATSYDYQWIASGTQIAGATATTLTLTAALVHQTIQVRVTPHTFLYDTTPRLSGAVQVEPAPLSNTVRPTVVDTPKAGETLTADEGAWSSTPDEFAYQWYLNGIAADATAKTWLVPESAAGQTAQVFVGATKAGHTPAYALSTGSAPIEPTATTPPPAPVALQNTVGVSISGTPKVDETLTAVEGTWEPEATSYLYQWYLNGIPVDGATSQTWVVPASAEGQAAQVMVAALRNGYQPGYDISDGTVAIAPIVSPTASPSATATASATETASTSPSATATASATETTSTSPSVTASASPTETTSTSPSVTASASPTETTSTSPSATASASASSTETTSTSPSVTASTSPSPSISTTNSMSASPTATQTTLKRFVFATKPTMIGRPRFGYVLSYVRPSMSPAPAVVSFRWLRDGKPIRYATANRYRIRYRDRGHVIRLRVSYARDYYATVRKVTNGKVIR